MSSSINGVSIKNSPGSRGEVSSLKEWLSHTWQRALGMGWPSMQSIFCSKVVDIISKENDSRRINKIKQIGL